MKQDNRESLEAIDVQNALSILKALTHKQRAVLNLLIQHHTTKEIARELNISPNTVDQRLLGAREKLGAIDRKQTARKYAALLELCEKTTYEFSLVDEHSEEINSLLAGLPSESGFDLRDSLDLSRPQDWMASRFEPAALDARFGKLWRVVAIPLLAILIGMVLVWGVAFAQALDEVL